MTSFRIRQYGQQEVTQIDFSGELEGELSQQFLAAISAGFIWPGYAEDFHITQLEGDGWVEV